METIKTVDGGTVTRTYEELCHELGIDASIKYVKVEAGRIGFTCGKREEAQYLLAGVKQLGYVPTPGLLDAVRDGRPKWW